MSQILYSKGQLLTSENDEATGFLQDELLAGGNITIVPVYDGGDEKLMISSTGAGATGVSLGELPAGMADDYGIYTPVNLHTMGVWSTRSSGAGNRSIALVADVDNPTIDADHKILSIGWVNSGDVYNEGFYFTDDTLNFAGDGSATILGTQPDGASSIAVRLGSSVEYANSFARLLTVENNSVVRASFDGYGQLTYGIQDNGQEVELGVLEELITIDAAASTDGSVLSQIPTNAIVDSVLVRVVTAIPGAATFDVGVSGATSRFISGVSVSGGTTAGGSDSSNTYYDSAAFIRITPNTTPSGATGRVRVTVFYRKFTNSTL